MNLAAYLAQLPDTPFVAALAELCAHEAQRLIDVRPLPIPAYIAGGAEVHLAVLEAQFLSPATVGFTPRRGKTIRQSRLFGYWKEQQALASGGSRTS